MKEEILLSVYPNPDVLADKDRRRARNPDRQGAFMNNDAHPEVLVETDWVKANLGRPGIKLVESWRSGPPTVLVRRASRTSPTATAASTGRTGTTSSTLIPC
jgi:hypothetical protein